MCVFFCLFVFCVLLVKSVLFCLYFIFLTEYYMYRCLGHLYLQYLNGFIVFYSISIDSLFRSNTMFICLIKLRAKTRNNVSIVQSQLTYLRSRVGRVEVQNITFRNYLQFHTSDCVSIHIVQFTIDCEHVIIIYRQF